jgi:hypothetical protein
LLKGLELRESPKSTHVLREAEDDDALFSAVLEQVIGVRPWKTPAGCRRYVLTERQCATIGIGIESNGINGADSSLRLLS